jgi:hypothetical protein
MLINAKKMVTILGFFLSFMVSIQEHKTHNILSMMLDPHFKGLGLVIEYVGKEKINVV